jgi:hypothetical protein
MPLVRHLADAAQNVDAYVATYAPEAAKAPQVAAEQARRYLAAGRVAEAGKVLAQASPGSDRRGRLETPDEDCETLWISFLEASDRSEEAQTLRWASFERTLSVERARDFISRLADFDDAEAEARAFAVAANHPEFDKGIRFLIGWPALGEAARMIEARPADICATVEEAELWAARLRRTRPKAAYLLLRKVAGAAFQRREFKTADRLTQEAEAIELPEV